MSAHDIGTFHEGDDVNLDANTALDVVLVRHPESAEPWGMGLSRIPGVKHGLLQVGVPATTFLLCNGFSLK